MTKTEFAKTYTEKYISLYEKNGHHYSKRFIATVMFNENPEIFKDEEDARFWIRYVTNSSGNNKRIKNIELSRRFAMIPEAVYETETTEPYIIPASVKKTLWMADIHGLFYDEKAFKIALDYGLKKGCDSVVILGDFLDFYDKSKFDKNPLVAQRFTDERDWGIEILELLQSCFGQVFLKLGNHDQRRELYIQRKSADTPEFMNLASYSDFLFFDKCHVQFIEAHRHLVYGKLNGIHGHEYGGGGIHIAYSRFNKALDNLISAHSHKAQTIVRPNINGNIYGSWALGCLCQLHPMYAPKNDWIQGFAVTEKDASGEFEVNNRAIYGNKSTSA